MANSLHRTKYIHSHTHTPINTHTHTHTHKYTPSWLTFTKYIILLWHTSQGSLLEYLTRQRWRQQMRQTRLRWRRVGSSLWVDFLSVPPTSRSWKHSSHLERFNLVSRAHTGGSGKKKMKERNEGFHYPFYALCGFFTQ